MRLMIGIVAFLIWAGGSGYWYACKIKGACNDSPQEVMTQGGGEPEQLADDAEGTAEEATDMNAGEEAAIAELGAVAEELIGGKVRHPRERYNQHIDQLTCFMQVNVRNLKIIAIETL